MKRIYKTFIFAVAMLLINTISTYSQMDWTLSFKTDKSNIKCFNAIEKNIFVGAETGGYYKSYYNSVFSPYLKNNIVLANLVLNDMYSDSNSIYFATSSGLFYSKFTNKIYDISLYGTDQIYFNIKKNINAIVVTNDNIIIGSDSLVIVKGKNDKDWKEYRTGLNNNSIISLKKFKNEIYAGTSKGGVFKSNDNGVSWTEFNTKMKNIEINSLYASETDNSFVLFACTNAGLYFTFDGKSWALDDSQFAETGIKAVTTVNNGNVFLITKDNNIYTDIFYSGTLNFNRFYNVTGVLSNLNINTIFLNDTILYVGTDKGIYTSDYTKSIYVGIVEEKPNINSFTINPNPSFKNINIILNSDVSTQSDLQIFDISGREILSKRLQIGAKAINVNTENLSSGLYYININNEIKSFIKW